MTTVLITGASRGMGADTARRLAAQGVTVLAGVRDPSALSDELRTTIIRPVQLDVTDDLSVADAVRTVERDFEAIDVLVNNAGVPGT